MMFVNISTCVIFSGQLVMSLSGCVEGQQGRLQCSWFTKASRPDFWTHSSLELFSNSRKQIDVPKVSSLLPQFHWLCHLPASVGLSFCRQLCLAWQPCVYSVLCTAATQDFLDSVQMKGDQAVVFLSCCDLRSFRIVSKQCVDECEHLLTEQHLSWKWSWKELSN